MSARKEHVAPATSAQLIATSDVLMRSKMLARNAVRTIPLVLPEVRSGRAKQLLESLALEAETIMLAWGEE